MKWSFKIGRILGIDVYIHATFLLLLGFVGVAHWLAGRSLEAGLTGVLFFGGMFLCVLLHEYGHAVAARRYGIATRDITLLPIGGVARLERMPDKPSQELVVAIAGPLVNIVIALSLFLGLQLSGHWQPLSSLTTTSGNLVERLLAVNVFLVLFNLLPAFPMDGGRVLRSLLAMGMQYARATHLAARIGQGMAVLFGFAGLFGNPMLLLIALFVWIGAAQEAGAVEMKAGLAGYLVRDAMQSEVRTLSPQDTLREGVEALLAGAQQDFPVVENGRVVGMLPRHDLLKGIHERGEFVTVASMMRPEVETLDANELLDWAVAHLNPDRGLSRPVLREGRLVGLLTAENLGEFYMIRRALAENNRNRPSPPMVRTPRVVVPVMSRQPGA